jgi:hypothetical protein
LNIKRCFFRKASFINYEYKLGNGIDKTNIFIKKIILVS